MRIAVLGVCLLVVSLIAVVGFGEGNPAAPATEIRHAIARGELIAFEAAVGDSIQQLTVVDPKRKSISVYHIELKTGKIQLRSVRNIDSDLRIEEYNAAHPLPHEIRSQLQHR